MNQNAEEKSSFVNIQNMSFASEKTNVFLYVSMYIYMYTYRHIYIHSYLPKIINNS